MKQKLIILILTIFTFQAYAQDTILVTDRKISAKKESYGIAYSFQKGDKVLVSIKVEKDKDVKEIVIKQKGQVLFSGKDVKSFENKELIAIETNFMNFYFTGPSMGSRDIEITIKRIPASADGIYFNTAIQQIKKYTTSTFEYEIDSVIGYQQPKYRPQAFRVISNVDYESQKIIEEKMNIKGVTKKYVTVNKPKDTIKTDNKEMVLLGYQIIITSSAGAAAMWKAIGIGVDVASLFLTPAAGIAAGTVFSMIGPQDGGEPVLFYIMDNDRDLSLFLDEDFNTHPMVFDAGLVTGSSTTWTTSKDKFFLGMENLNLYAEVDVSVAISAIYQATTWANVSQDQIIVWPETVKNKKQIQMIKNEKYYSFQK